MNLSLQLPTASGAIEAYTLRGSAPVKPTPGLTFNRIAYSAAHVVANPRAAIDPWLQCAIDWDATIAYRQRLWSLGLGEPYPVSALHGRGVADLLVAVALQGNWDYLLKHFQIP